MKKSARILGFLSISLLFFSMYTYVPVLPAFIRSMTGNPFLVGIIVGSYGIAQMLLRIPLGYFSDKWGKRKLFVIVVMLFSVISSGMVVFYQNPFVLLICRLFAGFTAAGWVPVSVLFVSYFDKRDVYKAVGLANSANQIGQSTAIIAGGVIVQLFNTIAVFKLSTIVASLGLLLSCFLFEETMPHSTENPIKSLIKSIKNRDILLPTLHATLSQFITFSTAFAFTPLYAQDIFHITPIQNSLLMLIFIFPSVFSSAIVDILMRIMSRNKIILISNCITTLFIILIPFAPSFSILLMIQGVLGCLRGLLMSLYMGQIANTSSKGIDMGIFQAVYAFGMFIGPILIGLIIWCVGNISAAFLASSIISLISIWILFLQNKKLND